MDQNLNIVLLGKTGVGKSASANTILRREAFKAETDFGSVTKHISVETETLFGRQISVIDTADILTSQEQIANVLQNVLRDSTPSLYLLVIRVDRFTEEDQKAVEAVERVLGPQRMEDCFLLFTGGDRLNTSLKQYISGSTTSQLPKIADHFSWRIHLFNNKDGGEEQVRELLTKAGHIETVSGKDINSHQKDEAEYSSTTIKEPGNKDKPKTLSVESGEEPAPPCDDSDPDSQQPGRDDKEDMNSQQGEADEFSTTTEEPSSKDEPKTLSGETEEEPAPPCDDSDPDSQQPGDDITSHQKGEVEDSSPTTKEPGNKDEPKTLSVESGEEPDPPCDDSDPDSQQPGRDDKEDDITSHQKVEAEDSSPTTKEPSSKGEPKSLSGETREEPAPPCDKTDPDSQQPGRDDKGANLEDILENLGLKQIDWEKLSLSKILEINKKIINDEPPK